MRSIVGLHQHEQFSQGERIRVADQIVQCHKLTDDTWSITDWATCEHIASGLRESEIVCELHKLWNDEEGL